MRSEGVVDCHCDGVGRIGSDQVSDISFKGQVSSTVGAHLLAIHPLQSYRINWLYAVIEDQPVIRSHTGSTGYMQSYRINWLYTVIQDQLVIR